MRFCCQTGRSDPMNRVTTNGFGEYLPTPGATVAGLRHACPGTDRASNMDDLQTGRSRVKSIRNDGPEEKNRKKTSPTKYLAKSRLPRCKSLPKKKLRRTSRRRPPHTSRRVYLIWGRHGVGFREIPTSGFLTPSQSPLYSTKTYFEVRNSSISSRQRSVCSSGRLPQSGNVRSLTDAPSKSLTSSLWYAPLFPKC